MSSESDLHQARDGGARRVAIITGAGSGIGAELANSLSADDFDVVLVGRRRSRLDETAASVERSSGRRPLVVDVDITEPTAPRDVVSATVVRFGRIDALLNNAGLARFGSLASTVDGDERRMFETNVFAPIALIREAQDHLRARRGVIVNIGSIGGILSLPQRSLYGASKAALHHLTRSLARELAPEIRVNAIVPGAIDTEIYRDLGLSEAETDKLRSELIATTPMGRLGTARDVVPWIIMLLGPAGTWVTGSLIVIDGGRSC